jgi:hypothetical protein
METKHDDNPTSTWIFRDKDTYDQAPRVITIYSQDASMNQGVGRSNRSGRATFRKGLFLKGNKPFSFQTEQIILGTPTLTLVNRGNVPFLDGRDVMGEQPLFGLM